MKRICLVTGLLGALFFVQCSKDKKEAEPVPAPNFINGLLAYFGMTIPSLYDSTGNIKLIEVSPTGVEQGMDRHANIASTHFNQGYVSLQPKNWNISKITITMWVYCQDTTLNTYLLTTNSAKIGFIQEGSRLGFAIGTATAMAPIMKKWIHVAGTFDGKVIRTYINGELKAEQSHSGDPGSITLITLGYKSNVYWWGNVDELRFYDRVLTNEEIQILAKY